MDNKKSLFYGWWIAAATFVILFIGLCSGFYTVSVFLEPIQQEFGWNRTTISLGFTIAALLVGLLSPAVGWAVSRFGVKGSAGAERKGSPTGRRMGGVTVRR